MQIDFDWNIFSRAALDYTDSSYVDHSSTSADLNSLQETFAYREIRQIDEEIISELTGTFLISKGSGCGGLIPKILSKDYPISTEAFWDSAMINLQWIWKLRLSSL